MNNIYQAIAEIMKEDSAIAKEQENTQQKFKYRGIDDVMNVFHPLLAKYGVFVVPEVLEQTREERVSGKGNTLLYSVLKVRYTFYAADGTSVSAVVIGEGMDSGDKASNKAMAAAMKYAMFQVFCIATEDMVDPDSESPEVEPKQKKPEPKSSLKRVSACFSSSASRAVSRFFFSSVARLKVMPSFFAFPTQMSRSERNFFSSLLHFSRSSRISSASTIFFNSSSRVFTAHLALTASRLARRRSSPRSRSFRSRRPKAELRTLSRSLASTPSRATEKPSRPW